MLILNAKFCTNLLCIKAFGFLLIFSLLRSANLRSLLQILDFGKTIITDYFFMVFRKCVVATTNSYTPRHMWLQKYKLFTFLNVLTRRKLYDKMVHFKMILSSLSINNFLLSSSCLYDITNILLDEMYSIEQMLNVHCK